MLPAFSAPTRELLIQGTCVEDISYKYAIYYNVQNPVDVTIKLTQNVSREALQAVKVKLHGCEQMGPLLLKVMKNQKSHFSVKFEPPTKNKSWCQIHLFYNQPTLPSRYTDCLELETISYLRKSTLASAEFTKIDMPIYLANYKDDLERDPQVIADWEKSMSLLANTRESKNVEMKEKLRKILANEKNRLIYLIDEPGSGKNLLAKMFTLLELDRYTSTGPITLYIRPTNLNDFTHLFIEKLLAYAGLKDHIWELKSRKLRIFISSFSDKGFLAKDIQNLIEKNQLNHNWPNLQLIVIGEPPMIAGSSVVSKQTILQMKPLGRSDIEGYISSFLTDFVRYNESRLAPFPLLATEAEYVNLLDRYNLWPQIKKIYDLEIILKVLPLMVPLLESRFSSAVTPITQFYNEYISQVIREEYIRHMKRNPKERQIQTVLEYLDFGTKLAADMSLCRISSVSLSGGEYSRTQEAASDRLKIYMFSDIPKARSLRRGVGIVELVDGSRAFTNQALLKHFELLGFVRVEREEAERHLGQIEI